MSKTDVITRKDMKEPDKFQQAATQAASWIQAKRRHVVLAGAAVVAVVVLIAILDAARTRRDERASAAASDLVAILEAPISQVPLPNVPGPYFVNEPARQQAIVVAAEKILAEHSGTGAAGLATLALGDASARLGQWDKAKAAWERYLAAAPKDDSLRFAALEGLALAAEAAGTPDAALAAYDRLAKEAPLYADRADLERARLLVRAGKSAEAKALLGEFATKHKDSALAAEASERLARLGGK